MAEDPEATLVLTVDPPWPPVSGADLRNWQTVLAAARKGPVSAVSLWRSPTEPTPPSGIRTLALSDASAADIYRRPIGGSAIDTTLPSGWEARLQAEVARLNPSAIVIEHIALRAALHGLAGSKLRRILDLHNIESALLSLQEPLWRRCLTLDHKVRALRNIERDLIARVDEVWVCSTVDAARLERLSNNTIRVRLVPNAIPATFGDYEALPSRLHRADGPKLLFVGHLSYRPNVRAAETLARDILPELLDREPRTRLRLAGRTPHRRVKALAGESIDIVADPVSVRDLYCEADIVVVPLRSGGGTRIKIIEAMAAGVPVVATAMAVEGLELEPGVHYRLASDSRTFQQEIERLWKEPELYRIQQESAHRFAWNHFNVEEISTKILAGLATRSSSTD